MTPPPDSWALPAGVTREQGWWYDEYRGPTEVFLQVGLVDPESLPACDAGKSRMASFRDGQRIKQGDSSRDKDERWMRIVRRVPRRGRETLTVMFGLAADEQKRRQAASHEQLEDERAATQKVRDALGSKDEYRGMLTHFLRVLGVHLGGGRSSPPYEYALADDEKASVQYAYGILEDAIVNGRIVVADRRLAAGVAARSDSRLQAFLRQTVESASRHRGAK
jgi:hypothetical protein